MGIPGGRINWLLITAIAIVGLSAMLPVIQNSSATTAGFALQDLQARKAQLEGEVRVLESDVARLTSLPRIERRATDIGLSPGSSPYFVTVNEPGPAPAKLPAEYLPVPVREGDGPESWWRSLFKWLPLPD
jgi:hypothetical protein